MILRSAKGDILDALARSPAVGLVGPRQIGKTTLAQEIGRESAAAIYLDLERPSDQAKLHDPETYLGRHAGSLVILDEVQRVPHLFPILRSLIDADRRDGRFLLLGSASPALARQAAESLAGRIAYLELGGLSSAEVGACPDSLDALWLRGGFPRSYLAGTDRKSFLWREDFIRTFLERDIPGLGFRVPSGVLRKFWQMLAHCHGQIWNASTLAAGLGLDGKTVSHHLEILEATFIVRRLPAFHANLKKRLTKSPKVYLRDSGLLHALHRLESLDDLLGHPIVGASWEGWVVEQVLTSLPHGCDASFFRTAAGAEIDLVVSRPGSLGPLAIEVKASADPRPARGFWSALADLGNPEGLIVCRAKEAYPLARNVSVVPATALGTLNWLNAGPIGP